MSQGSRENIRTHVWNGNTITVHIRSVHTDHTMHLCPDCQSDWVQPIRWQKVSKTATEVALRCPICHWTNERGSIYSNAAITAHVHHRDAACQLLQDWEVGLMLGGKSLDSALAKLLPADDSVHSMSNSNGRGP